MSATNQHIDDLLVKVMLGEASPEEQLIVQEWRAFSEENEHYFQDLGKIWEESRKLMVQSTVDEGEAWERFKNLRDVQPEDVRAEDAAGNSREGNVRAKGGDRGAKVRVIGRVWRVAAVVLLVVSGGWFYYSYSYRPGQFLSVNSGERVVLDTLPEGSVVTLNKASFIKYKRSFGQGGRNVEMDGEVFFNVAQDKNSPFTVQANGATITVLGTSFNVNVRQRETEVVVETGMIEINKNGRVLRVAANEKAVISEAGVRKEKNADELYNYYRTRLFECNGTPLWRLVEKLNEVYNVHIVIGEERLRGLQLTTTFEDQSLDQILNVVAKTFKITMEKKGGDIILK